MLAEVCYVGVPWVCALVFLCVCPRASCVCVPAGALCVCARARAVCASHLSSAPSFPSLTHALAPPSLSLTQMQINDAAAMEQQMKMGGAGPQVVI